MKKMVSTDVLKTDSTIYRDLERCCLALTTGQKYFLKGNVFETSIWNLPEVADIIVKKEANRAVVKNILEMIRNYEQSYSSVGIAACHYISSKKFLRPGIKYRSNFSTIVKNIEKNINCNFSKKVLLNVKKYGNPQMSISVTREPVSKPIIKFKNNPSIRIKVPDGFNLKDNKIKNCKFYMVDGSVSKPSEIMKLLNESFENKKTNYFLVCKSFNEEILFTLKENYDRSITNVIPLEYGFDLDSINCIPDLVSVVGGQPFSPSLGDVLSTVDLSRMGHANSVEILKENMVIQPSIRQNKTHIRNLLQNIENSNEDKRRLLAKRLVSLRGNSCNITLPKSASFDHAEINIRHSAKMLKDMCSNGVTEMHSGNRKFYIPYFPDIILEDLQNKINNVLTTKIVLSRRKKHGKE